MEGNGVRCHDGEIYPVNAEYHKGDTVLKRSMFDHDSLLLWLEPAGTGEENSEFGSACEAKKCSCALDISDQVEIVRSEPNVSILDLAEYAFDGGEWQDEDEILRIDNRFRENWDIRSVWRLLRSHGPTIRWKVLNILWLYGSISIPKQH